MPLLVVWGNLVRVTVALLPLGLVTVLFAALLYRAWRSVTRGPNDSPGTLVDEFWWNLPPELPLSVFGALALLSLFILYDTGLFATYVLPFGLSSGGQALLLGLEFGACVGGAGVVAGYFIQAQPRLRRYFLQIAVLVGATVVVVAAAAGRTPPIGLIALAPVSLFVGLISIWIARRASYHEVSFGPRALGLTSVPLYFIAAVAVIRLAQLIALAG